METERPDRHSRPIVAFDFDGTLTIRDSYTSFLKWRNGPLAYGLGLSALTPDLLAYALHRDRGRLKAAATKRFLAGEMADAVAAQAAAFCETYWATLMRPDALEVWNRWGEPDGPSFRRASWRGRPAGHESGEAPGRSSDRRLRLAELPGGGKGRSSA